MKIETIVKNFKSKQCKEYVFSKDFTVEYCHYTGKSAPILQFSFSKGDKITIDGYSDLHGSDNLEIYIRGLGYCTQELPIKRR